MGAKLNQNEYFCPHSLLFFPKFTTNTNFALYLYPLARWLPTRNRDHKKISLVTSLLTVTPSSLTLYMRTCTFITFARCTANKKE
jgi:hypothetical protein